MWAAQGLPPLPRPIEHAQILNPQEPKNRFKNFGIRLVYGIAKEVNYQNLLDQNVLTIHL